MKYTLTLADENGIVVESWEIERDLDIPSYEEVLEAYWSEIAEE